MKACERQIIPGMSSMWEVVVPAATAAIAARVAFQPSARLKNRSAKSCVTRAVEDSGISTTRTKYGSAPCTLLLVTACRGEMNSCRLNAPPNAL